jgi:hypothetical protein
MMGRQTSERGTIASLPASRGDRRDLSDPFQVFIRGEPGFERSKVGQTLIDIGAVLACFLLLVATAGSVVVSLFLLFFCSFS